MDVIFELYFIFSLVFSILTLALWRTLRKVELDDVTNKSVVITGCDTGFGNLLARSLDARGVRVFACCLRKEGAAALEESTSSRLKTIIMDVTNRESVAEAMEIVMSSLNGEGVWGLVNNAGILPALAPIEWTSMEEFEFTCDVNLFGAISVTKAFLPLIRKSQGRIVNVCSVTSNIGYPGIAAYVISKSAVKWFSICLRRELLKTGVTVHIIEPGGFQTNITDKHRLQGMLRDAYKQAHPETREVYGGHIATYLHTGLEAVKHFVSPDAHLVPDAMTHALLAKYPRQKYLVGTDAKVYFRVLLAIPSWIVDHIFGWPKPYGPKLPILEE